MDLLIRALNEAINCIGAVTINETVNIPEAVTLIRTVFVPGIIPHVYKLVL